MQKKLHIKVNDNVKVIAGEHKGSTGKVLTINRVKNRAIVEGVNVSKKHVKPQVNKEKPDGGIIEKEASIHISNLMLLDPKSGEVTRVGRKTNEAGKAVRYAKKSGEEIN
ncbi:MAG: 50S ribosomal protein L24 [Flavobacteriales bacterium]